MKKITNLFKISLIAFTMMFVKTSMAQTCTATFVYGQNANGNVTFSSTAIPANSVTAVYYWTFGSSIPTFTGTGTAGKYPSYTYTANGTYVVTLFVLSTAPSCSTQTQQTITITSVGSSTCNLAAAFTYTQGSNGLANFTNLSTGTVSGTTYLWNFGDNSTSTALNPTHTYSANGSYIVTLVANNNFSTSCTATVQTTVNVNSYCTLVAGFNPVINSNGNVSFVNQTTPSVGVSYSWNFGNSNTSSATNPNTTYTANGTYTVTLVANSTSTLLSGCTSSAIAVITITNVAACNINAVLFASAGSSSGLINFINATTGTLSGVTYTWSFGDNTAASNAFAPAHTYSANGTYIATLTANNNMTISCSSTKTLAVFVNSYCNLSAGFTPSLGANGSVSFANTTTGTTSSTGYSWNFGDASTGTGANPSHTYFNGTYTVILTATNYSVVPACSSTVAQVITVTSNTCVANAGFTLLPTSTPQYWTAIPSSTTGITAAQWSWGDGNTSNTLFTSHVYSVAATYTICLSVTVSCGASASYCTTYYIFRSSSASSNDIIRVDVIEPGAVGLSKTQSEIRDFSIFPNPTNGLFTLNMNTAETGAVKVNVYNVVGQKILETTSELSGGKYNKELNLATEPAGVYFVEITAGNASSIKKIVVSK